MDFEVGASVCVDDTKMFFGLKPVTNIINNKLNGELKINLEFKCIFAIAPILDNSFLISPTPTHRKPNYVLPSFQIFGVVWIGCWKKFSVLAAELNWNFGSIYFVYYGFGLMGRRHFDEKHMSINVTR